MKTLMLGMVLAVALSTGCGSSSNSEGDSAAVQTPAVEATAKPELTSVEIGEAFAYYSAQELKD